MPLPQPLPLSAKTTYRGPVPPPPDRNPKSQPHRSRVHNQPPAAEASSASFGTASKFDFTMEPISAPFAQPPGGKETRLPPTKSSTTFSTLHASTSALLYPDSKFLKTQASSANLYSMPGGLVSDENEALARAPVDLGVLSEAKRTDGINPVGSERKGKARAFSHESTVLYHSSVPPIPRAPMYKDEFKARVRYSLNASSRSSSGSDSESESELPSDSRVHTDQSQAKECDGGEIPLLYASAASPDPLASVR